MERIIISNSVTKIGYATFRYCTSLTDITIPNSIIDIGDSAFENCKSLISITIPNSINKIGNAAFKNVNHITYTGKSKGTPWGSKSIN